MSPKEKACLARISKLIERRKVTQDQLGKALDLKQYQVSRILSGHPFPSLDQLITIAEELDSSLYYLLGVQEESYRELSKEDAALIHAYESSDESSKEVVKRILDI
jgi:transcriptional regulator with XRE-family HTH domain